MNSQRKKTRFGDKVKRTIDRQKRETSGYGYLNVPDGIRVFSPEPGSSIFMDIIPYIINEEHHPNRDDATSDAIPNELWFERPFWIHRDVGAKQDSIICLKSIGQRCPICEYQALRRKQGAAKDELIALSPKFRFLYYIIPLQVKTVEEVPHVMEISYHNFTKLLRKETDTKPEFLEFPNLEDGYTLEVRFDAESMGEGSKPFAKASRIDFYTRDPYDESILEGLPDLGGLLNILSYSELEKLFFDYETDTVPQRDQLQENKEITDYSPPNRTRRNVPEIEKDPEMEEENQNKRKNFTAPTRSAPTRSAPTRATPARSAPARSAPTRATPARSAPARSAPARSAPARSAPTRPAPPVEENHLNNQDTNGCPHTHTFGKDTDKFVECVSCDKWDDCIEQKTYSDENP